MPLCRISPLASAIAALLLIPAAQADEASQDMEVIVVATTQGCSSLYQRAYPRTTG